MPAVVPNGTFSAGCSGASLDIVENIRIRRVRPDDERALVGFYARLSDESRRARFLGTRRGLDSRCAHELCAPANLEEAGFVAERLGDAAPHIVGHVCLTRAGRGCQELAIAVADEMQGHGLGHELFRAALTWAEHDRVERIVAVAFSDNWRVLRLLGDSGHATVLRDDGAGTSSVSIDLNDHQPATRAA